jgi:hypothetical protein
MTESGKERIVMLNKYDFQEWLVKSEVRGIRKVAITDEKKFSFLLETLPPSYEKLIIDLYAKKHKRELEDPDAAANPENDKKLYEKAIDIATAKVALGGETDATVKKLFQENFKDKFKNLDYQNSRTT